MPDPTWTTETPAVAGVYEWRGKDNVAARVELRSKIGWGHAFLGAMVPGYGWVDVGLARDVEWRGPLVVSHA
jgi:hypothetical protein